MHFGGVLISVWEKLGSLSSQQSMSDLFVQITLSIFYFPHLSSVICLYALINICPYLGNEAYNCLSIVNLLLWFWLILVLFCLCLLRQMMLSAL